MENIMLQPMETYGIYGGIHTAEGGVAELNIAPGVPAMTMFRYIIFGAIIGIISKSIFGVKND